MKNYRYIYLVALLVFASGCAGTGEMAQKREAERELQKEAVLKSLESGNFVIRASKIYARRYSRMDLKPTHNYLVVEENMARINLAYFGRSYSIRAISGINVSGQIEEMSITPGRKGSHHIEMQVRGSGELFTISVNVSASGECNMNITNARIDSVSYGGKLMALI